MTRTRRTPARTPALIAIAAAAAAAALCGPMARAQTLQYRVDATVTLITPTAAGFPAELAGLVFGSPVTFLLEFDRGATVDTPYDPGPPYSSATHYAMASARVTLRGGSAPLDLSQGAESLWVWNDDIVLGTMPQDGLVMQNTAAIGTLGYTVLSGLLPTTTWADEALPEASIAMALQVALNRLGQGDSFFRANGSRLQVSVVPEPATWSMALAGTLLLGGLAARARRCGPDQAMSPPR